MRFMILSKSYFERERGVFLPLLRKKVISKILNALSKFLIYRDRVRGNRDRVEFTWHISCFVRIANPHNRRASTFIGDLIPPGSYRWIPSQFCATNQTHKVWPNMDTSPFERMAIHRHIYISVWWGSLTESSFERYRVSHRVSRYPSTSSDVYYDAHAFFSSHDRAPTTSLACRSLNEPRR